MTQQHFVDPAGRYRGSFDGTAPPAGSIEVPTPPPGPAGFYTWDFVSAWVEDADRADREAERGITAGFERDKLARLLFEVNFDQEKRLRQLEGRPAITKAQYRDALIAKYKTL